MKQVLIIIFFFANLGVDAQVTSNPKIKKKSTKDVFINKIEITEDRTVFSMQFVAKTPKETVKEYLEDNPEDKKELQNMDPFMRNLYLQQMMQRVGNSTISFQPNSYLRTSNGKKYKFIKAVDIPVAPNRKDVESGKKYFFKVYFEKFKNEANKDYLSNFHYGQIFLYRTDYKQAKNHFDNSANMLAKISDSSKSDLLFIIGL